MTKSLVIARVFPPQFGGSGRFLWEIYRRQPVGSAVMAAGRHEGSEAFDSQSPQPIRRLPLHFANWGLTPAGFLAYGALAGKLRRLVRREAIGALHAATFFPEGFLAWMLHRWTGLPYLCYLHGEEIEIAASSRELRWMAHRVLGSASSIVANSENTRSLLAERFAVPPDRVSVLTPGVDAKRFCPAAPSASLRARLGWQDRNVILTVGRLQERKGHDRLIEALTKIRTQIPDVLYAIAGAGDRRESLETLSREQGVSDCVQFLGEIHEDLLVECYQQCDLFALPNRTCRGDIEGFGMVLVEAQACGKPVLAGDSGGTRETMASQTGEIIDCEDPATIAAAVARLLLDSPRRVAMGAAAREWAQQHFDWAGIADRASLIFKETIEARRCGAPRVVSKTARVECAVGPTSS